jgi:altronate dehydratase
MPSAPTRTHMILHPTTDNVAIALKPFDANETIEGITIKEPIRAYHKIALTNLAMDQAVYKYGQIIGYTTQPVTAGTSVHTHNLDMSRLMDTAITDLATAPPDPLPTIDDRYFLGYRDSRGRAGTRNYVLIGSTVDCSARVVEMALEELNRKQAYYARRYPNVDGVVGLTHDSGCGLVTMSQGHIQQNRTIQNLMDHPNVGGRVIVQLGCEKGQAALIFGEDQLIQVKDCETAPGNAMPLITIQETGGTWKTVDRIVDYVEEVLLPEVNARRRTLIPASELILATQCGGSNANSGFTSNAAIGYASDLLVRCGGTSFIAETTETFGAGHLLTQRAKTPEIAQAYLDHVATYRSYLAAGEGTPENNLAYGNIEGGLSTIAEKALGSIAKGGTTALAWVNDYAELITEKGFGFMNTPAFDPASCTGQTAGGAQVGVFSTGAGSCFGGILTPWLKVVSNSDTFARMEDMEVNAGTIADGTENFEDVGKLIFEYVLALASGSKTYSEKVGYSVANIWNKGVTT